MSPPSPDFELLRRRLESLEFRLEALSERVERLERLRESAADSSAAPVPEARPESTLAELKKRFRWNEEAPEVSKAAPAASPPPPPRFAASPAPFPGLDVPRPDAGQAAHGAPKARFDWKAALRRVQMWPPETEGNREIVFGAWWAPRIGGALLAIFAVFFGVYMTRNTPPAVRFAELLALSMGVAGFGHWLERKQKKLARILFATGLSMAYFCAFGGYAAPAIRIIPADRPGLASAVQFSAALAIIACSIWKQSHPTAALAFVYGYLSCMFSLAHGQPDLALLSAFALAAGAAGLRRLKGWAAPLAIAAPFSFLILFIVAVAVWIAEKGGPVSPAIAFSYPLGFLAVFLLSDWSEAWRGRAMSARPRRWLMTFAGAAAAGIGFLIAHQLFRGALADYYFLFGGVFLAFAFALWRVDSRDALLEIFTLKGSALVTLGVIESFEGRTRWIALAVQSLLMLIGARRSKIKMAEAAWLAVWGFSLLFFGWEIWQRGYIDWPAGPWTAAGAAALAYVLFSAWLFCLQARWLGGETPAGWRASLNALLALAAGAAAAGAALGYAPADWRPLWAALLAPALAAVGLGRAGRHWIPFAAAAVALLAGHLFQWNIPARLGLGPGWRIWINGWAVAGATLAAALALRLRIERGAEAPLFAQLRALEPLVHALWLATACSIYYRTAGEEAFFALCVATACGAAALSLRPRFSRLADLAAWPMLFALLALAWTRGGESFRLPARGEPLTLALAAAGAFGLACAFARSERLREGLEFLAPGQAWQWAFTALAGAIGWLALDSAFVGAARLLAFALAALGALGLARWPGLAPGLVLGLAYLAGSYLEFFAGEVPHRIRQGASGAIAASLAGGALAIVFAIASNRLHRGLASGHRRRLHWALGLTALGGLFALFVRCPGFLGHNATVFWGLTGLAIFLAGLADRSKPLRIVGGGVGLGLCVARAFLHDIESPLYRIAAFGVLGALLFLLGFLYNRYRGWIERFDDAGETR